MKNSGSSQKLGSFLSPISSNHRERNIGSQKGWSSERVLQTASSSHRHASVSGLTPISSGRTMPSKWDDAERWICSPLSGYANNRNSSSYAQLHRRPKSKSGPIVPPGTAYYYSNYSPTIPLRQGLVVKNLMAGSPFSTGVLAPDVLSIHHFDAHDTVFGPRYHIDNGIQYSSIVLNENGVGLPSVSSAPTWSELLCGTSSPNSQDEENDGTKHEETAISPFSKCDKGTQMSPPESDDDAHSSPKSSATGSMDQQNCHSTKLEVRDVQVDSEETALRWSKSNAEIQASCWDIAESTLDVSKFQREEAKITAWESLQKAKAEAEIRKLEMKLEKKRAVSMDKIVNKLRRAQMKAEKKRSLIPVQQGQQVSKPWKVFSFPKYGHIWSPITCFTTTIDP
ncbi:unnamed protein product [Lupinus luteus]|uniref:Remorin C-terminal domain-containing protein n=1 Tax=Lupinus luteus TaxID=3873 RepID=A0AAV1YFM1_LUPLU